MFSTMTNSSKVNKRLKSSWKEVSFQVHVTICVTIVILCEADFTVANGRSLQLTSLILCHRTVSVGGYCCNI